MTRKAKVFPIDIVADNAALRKSHAQLMVSLTSVLYEMKDVPLARISKNLICALNHGDEVLSQASRVMT